MVLLETFESDLFTMGGILQQDSKELLINRQGVVFLLRAEDLVLEAPRG